MRVDICAKFKENSVFRFLFLWLSQEWPGWMGGPEGQADRWTTFKKSFYTQNVLTKRSWQLHKHIIATMLCRQVQEKILDEQLAFWQFMQPTAQRKPRHFEWIENMAWSQKTCCVFFATRCLKCFKPTLISPSFS